MKVYFLATNKGVTNVVIIIIFICSYIIPTPVIKHFLNGVEESGHHVSFCSMDLQYQTMGNIQIRNHFKMSKDMTGILINRINPLSDAHKVLKKNDVILAIDGVPIGNDGEGNSPICNFCFFFTFSRSY